MYDQTNEGKGAIFLKQMENEDFGYIPERLKMIRRELQKETKEDLYDQKMFAEALGMSAAAFNSLENNRAGTSFRVVFKIIHFFTLMGYNPLWIISKDNLLIPKKNHQSEFILNRSNVDNAFNQLNQDIKAIQEETNTAIERFKKQITS
ncbi:MULTISPECIES: helix-turn-helix transcriptional regulator [Flavobacteriaceae]|uniref:helix-turn-helix domain-containing protein n=1 Tax=Flavobacteriaceae TaxID=49546 RepID=UPI0010ADD1E1|nr:MULTISPECIES: helix-turn-helix transcriptional regulator [Flavobacteriaceae]NJB38145.1 helix-turn-helix transcriptional regulator [Croceivirga sp. JEA036]TKD59000.1 helix-turn-helix transcriptional regulator [Flavobacterium sp. ASW18X]